MFLLYDCSFYFTGTVSSRALNSNRFYYGDHIRMALVADEPAPIPGTKQSLKDISPAQGFIKSEPMQNGYSFPLQPTDISNASKF